MNIKCPHCGTEYEVEKKDMYRYTKCEVCGKGFVVGATTSMLSSDDARVAAEHPTQAPTHKKFTTRREQPVQSRGGHVTMSSRFERPQNGATSSAPSATATKVKSGVMKKVITIIGVVLGAFLVAGVAAVGVYLCLGDEVRLNRGVMCYEQGLYSEAYELLLPLATNGHAKAQLLIGDCFANGQGVLKNTNEAVKWYRQAAYKELPEAQYRMFVCYRDGVGVERNLENAAKLCRKAAEAGLYEAMFDMGMLYVEGAGVDANAESAFRWFLKGAECGYPPALYKCGQCYKIGYGVEKNEDEAAKWQNKAVEPLRTSANADNALAMVQLANLYKEGDVVVLDKEEAAKWFRKSAELGNVEAQISLAACYHNGEGVNANQEEAAKWMLKASKKSADRDFQWTMGRYYQEGWGVEKDPTEAVKWFERAAKKGLAKGKYYLAMCYVKGEGVPRDEDMAEALLKEALNAGCAEAQEELYRIKREKSEKERRIEELSSVEVTIMERKGRINDILKGRMKGVNWLIRFDADKVAMTDASVSITEEPLLESVADSLSAKNSLKLIDAAILSAKKESERLGARIEELMRVKNNYDALELESRKETCTQCNGTCLIACTRCKGDGKILVKSDAQCPACIAGRVTKQITCSNCRGTGETRRKCSCCHGKQTIAIEEPGRLRRYEKCNVCNGSGLGDPWPCSRCHGNKTVEVSQPCMACKERGNVIKRSNVTCPACNGNCKFVCDSCGGQGFSYKIKLSDIVFGDILELKQKALNGNAEAQTNLGICFERGYAVRQDTKEALKWYDKAAAHGSTKIKLTETENYAWRAATRLRNRCIGGWQLRGH